MNLTDNESRNSDKAHNGIAIVKCSNENSGYQVKAIKATVGECDKLGIVGIQIHITHYYFY